MRPEQKNERVRRRGEARDSVPAIRKKTTTAPSTTIPEEKKSIGNRRRWISSLNWQYSGGASTTDDVV